MTVDLSSLHGKSVLITGASRGIGAEAVRVFAAAGARVGMIARDSAALSGLATQTGAMPIPCDMADFGAVAQAVATMQDRFGGLDVLVNNAGVIDPIAPLAQADPDEFGRLMDINLKGVFHGMRAALPVLPQGGTIITVGSGAAHNPLEGWGAYCSSKAGAWMLTRVAALEAPHLRLFSLSPGTVATDMQRSIRDSGINPVSQLDWSAH
ncbi:MAG: SDR family NAD(P)-dependent oxidoreductase, partial [Alphaproteobacteria bacterium]|nr:SDR family NAD(P)-dependent oxidoreductase [Alphaproteobacteria bacterium]